VRHEFVERVVRRGQSFELLISSGDSMRTGGPYAMLGAALRGAANISGFEPIEVQRKRLAKHVTRRLPEKHARRVSSFLGEVTGIHFPDDDYPPLAAARHDPRVMADQTLAAWLDYIEAEVDHQPVLLVMEDLHWGDTPSVRLVDAALRVLREKALLVVAFARPEIDDRFAGLWDEHGLQRMHLAPLTSKACQKIARAVLGEIGEERAAWITERADGNPFFLEELLRASAEAGDTNAAQKAVEALPTTVLGVVQARFDALGGDGKRVLRAASIYGKTFRRSALVPLLGEKAAHDLDTWLDVLEGRDIVIANDVAGTREFVFRHALLREAAYDTVTDADRALGHRLAGEWLEKHGEGERDAMVLVEHFERAGLRKRAAEWCKVAAEQALEANDLPAVLVRVARGISNGADGEALARMEVASAEAHLHLGDAEAGEQAARRALRTSGGSVRFSAIGVLAQCLVARAQFDEMEAWHARLHDEYSGHDKRAWQESSLRVLDALAMRGRDLAVVRESLDRVCADDLDDDPLLTALRSEVNWRLETLSGRVASSLEKLSEAHAAYVAAGDQREACRVLLNLGVAQADAGLLEEAESSLRGVLQMSAREGIRSLAPYATVNLALVSIERGDLQGAVEYASRGVEEGHANKDPRVEGFAYYQLARALCELGRWSEAQDAARRARSILAHVEALLPAVDAVIARTLMNQGETEAALATAAAAHVLASGAQAVEDGEALVRVVYAECLAAAGDHRAGDAISYAVQRLEERALAIGDPAVRHGFGALLEHRRTLELFRQLKLRK
jgi:tetratricopeptide (TPR) repeat protein